MNRHVIYAALLWAALTVIGEILAANALIFPVSAAEEARLIDGAFRFLMTLGAPVFAFVVAVLFYSVIRFRVRGQPEGDGPPIHTSRWVTLPWIAITSALAIFVIFNPGLKGLAELRANPTADLVVQIQAEQWNWTVVYPEYGVTVAKARELVLPAHRRVKFEVTSTDVIHSFWIPAFRLKIDAVPGLTTEMYVTPNRIGTFDDDFNLRVQCAELCGTGHSRMRLSLRIVEAAEFEAWISQPQPQGSRAHTTGN